jgi:hypothetical protein
MNSLKKVMCYQVFVYDGKIVGCFASKLSLGIARVANLCALFLKDTGTHNGMGYKMTSFAPSMSPSCRRVLILLIAWQM